MSASLNTSVDPFTPSRTRSISFFQVFYLLILFSACVVRAAGQSIVSSEAWMNELFLTSGFGHIFHSYDAANHFLQTYLCYFALKLFGHHDLTLRLPSLAGALLYMTGCLRLCNWAFPQRFWAGLALVWLTLNPFLLDFMVAARGYGLALGLFAWLLYRASRVLASESANYRALGYLAGLCIAANLAFLVPTAALISLVLALELSKSQTKQVTAWRLTGEVIGPAIVVLVLLASLSLNKATAADFYFGSPTISYSYRRLYEVALEYRPSLFAKGVAGGALTRIAQWSGRETGWILAAIIPVAVLSGRRLWRKVGTRTDLFLVLSATVLGLCVLMLLVGHRITGAAYPLDRTGIYFFLLVGLCVAAAGAALDHTVRPATRVSWLGWVMAGILGLQVFVFAGEWNPRYFYLWQYDAHTAKIVDLIAARHDVDDLRKVRIGATFWHEPTLNYYIEQKRLSWILPVERTPVDQPYDFYVLSVADHPLIARRGLHVIYRDQLSGVILARAADCTDTRRAEAVRVAR